MEYWRWIWENCWIYPPKTPWCRHKPSAASWWCSDKFTILNEKKWCEIPIYCCKKIRIHLEVSAGFQQSYKFIDFWKDLIFEVWGATTWEERFWSNSSDLVSKKKKSYFWKEEKKKSDEFESIWLRNKCSLREAASFQWGMFHGRFSAAVWRPENTQDAPCANADLWCCLLSKELAATPLLLADQSWLETNAPLASAEPSQGPRYNVSELSKWNLLLTKYSSSD